MPEHCASGQCQRPAKCVNCSGDHPANSKECPQWEKEKKILKIKLEQNLSFPEARKQYEQFYQARTYASAVKPGTCNKSTETHNNSTQTDDSFTEYLEQQTQEKQQEPPKGKSQEKGNTSRQGQTLKPATLETKRRRKKKKKTNSKNNKKRMTATISHRKSTERKRRSRKSNTSSEESIFCV